MDILFTVDYTPFDKYDKYTSTKLGYKYSDLIKREQKFLGSFLTRRYPKIHVRPNLCVMVYIHANFGKRDDRDYKVVPRGSKDYKALIQTDDWTEVGGFQELKEFLTTK